MESGGGGGVESRRKEKGERMKVTSPSLPTPTTSLSFPVLILLGPYALGQCTRAKKAGVQRKSERAKKRGKTVVLAQLFSLRSPYYLTA